MSGLSAAIRDAEWQCHNGAIRTAVIRRMDGDDYKVIQQRRLAYLSRPFVVIRAFAPTKTGVVDDAPALVLRRAAECG